MTEHLGSQESPPEPADPTPGQEQDSLPPDSPSLGAKQASAVTEAVKDRRWRRYFRAAIIACALVVLFSLICFIGRVVETIATAVEAGLKPENVAGSVAKEVTLQFADAASGVLATPPATQPNELASSAPGSKANARAPTGSIAKVVKIEAKIFGEIRDALLPVVALVSILTVALVAILVTMLRSSFAPEEAIFDKERKRAADDSIPVPLIEALRGLIDSIKAAFGK